MKMKKHIVSPMKLAKIKKIISGSKVILFLLHHTKKCLGQYHQNKMAFSKLCAEPKEQGRTLQTGTT